MTYMSSLGVSMDWSGIIKQALQSAPSLVEAFKTAQKQAPGLDWNTFMQQAQKSPEITVNMPAAPAAASTSSSGLPTWAIVAMVAGGVLLLGGVGLMAMKRPAPSTIPH
jgi:uncharacterized protein involved in exopolysaccharide biosynthesis